MVDNELASLPSTFIDDGSETQNMGAFPDATVTLVTKGANQAFEDAAIAAGDITAEVLGYLLYGNQLVTDVDGDGTYDAGDGDAILEVDYVAASTSTYYYTCESDGTIRQFNMADLDGAGIVEYTY